MAATKNTSKKNKTVPEVLENVIDGETVNSGLELNDVTEGQIHIDDSSIINVRSNVFGKLIYIDKRTQESVIWPRCGSEQQISFGMLRNMKATSVDFYENQWIIITGFADENAEKYKTADIYKSLMITKYYKNLIEPSDYIEICSWEPEEITEKVSMMSDGAKTNLAVALNTYIEKGILDSLKRIKAFAKALECELKIPE